MTPAVTAMGLSAIVGKLNCCIRALEALREAADEDTAEALTTAIARITAEASALELEADIQRLDHGWTREQRMRGLVTPMVKEEV